MSLVRSIARAAILCLFLLGFAGPSAAADYPGGEYPGGGYPGGGEYPGAEQRWSIEERPAADGAPALTLATDRTTGEVNVIKYDGGALGPIWLSDCDDPVRNPAVTAIGALVGAKPACRFARSAGDGNAEGDGDWVSAAAAATLLGAGVPADAIQEARRSPDGAHLLVWVGGDRTDAIWALRSDGSQPRLLALGEHVVLHGLRWTAVGAAELKYQGSWGRLRTATTSLANGGAGSDMWTSVETPLTPDPADPGARFDVLHGVTLSGASAIADVAVERATGKRFVIRTWTPAGVGGSLTSAWLNDCGDAARNPSGSAYAAVRGETPACTFARTTPVPGDPKPSDPVVPDPAPTTPQAPQADVKPPVVTTPPITTARVKLIAVGTRLGGKKKNLLTVKFAAIDGKGLRIQLVIRGKGGKADTLLARKMLTAQQAKAGSYRLKLSAASVKKLRAVKGKGLAVQLSALTADARGLA